MILYELFIDDSIDIILNCSDFIIGVIDKSNRNVFNLLWTNILPVIESNLSNCTEKRQQANTRVILARFMTKNSDNGRVCER